LSVNISTTKLTYIPIPASAGEKFAGLITINLPGTIHKGMEFAVIVQRITTRSFTPVTIPVPKLTQPTSTARKAVVSTRAEATDSPYYWRQIIGSFSLHIPVINAASLLPQEYDTLAILQWRLTKMPTTYRWYPILQQLVDITKGRVEGAGGDPTLIPPGGSPKGAPPNVTLGCLKKCPCCPEHHHQRHKPHKHPHHPQHQHQHHKCKKDSRKVMHEHKELLELCGRICEILFNHEGCCGFVLTADCCGAELRFVILEKHQGALMFRIKEAFEKKLFIGVLINGDGDMEAIGFKVKE